MPDRKGLKAWIRHLADGAEEARPTEGVTGPQPPADDGHTEGLQLLETRIEHLEKLLEGLQDSVHRETERQDKLIAELQARVEPGTMGAALSQDARDRGL